MRVRLNAMTTLLFSWEQFDTLCVNLEANLPNRARFPEKPER